jgi:hypothetical protein
MKIGKQKKNKKCKGCGREAGIVPHRSHKRTYNVVLAPVNTACGEELYCQWCRGKMK